MKTLSDASFKEGYNSAMEKMNNGLKPSILATNLMGKRPIHPHEDWISRREGEWQAVDDFEKQTKALN